MLYIEKMTVPLLGLIHRVSPVRRHELPCFGNFLLWSLTELVDPCGLTEFMVSWTDGFGAHVACRNHGNNDNRVDRSRRETMKHPMECYVKL